MSWKHRLAVNVFLLVVYLLPTVALGQPFRITFSLDSQGPSTAGPGPFTGSPGFFAGLPLDEGQILTQSVPGPPGPNPPLPGLLPPPGVMVTSVPSTAGVFPGGLGVVPGVLGAVEVDALSYGRDAGSVLYFSVDEWAHGDPRFTPAIPNLLTEGAAGAAEAAADVFRYLGPVPLGPLFPAPPLPFAGGPGNLAYYDGDGVVHDRFGLGLIEPNLPGPARDVGDNLDAFDLFTTIGDVAGVIFLSLDSNFADPLEAFFPPMNSGTARGNSFSGGDVLLTLPGAIPRLYAPATALGLDFSGFDTDDLDALAVVDAGIPFLFEPGIDTILFSVRRNSAIIGTIDSNAGIPIEEGDVLTSPLDLGAPPAIVVPAEMMGLATVRSGTAMFGFPGDDLDGLDVADQNNADFNDDGTYDCLDIDALVAAIVVGGGPAFDLTGDGAVDLLDLDTWLVEAGANNLGPGKSYLPADANLDGAVDTSDLHAWNGSKFTSTAAWCRGDFNADGAIDASDFNIWNEHKFTVSGGVSAVPEAGVGMLSILAVLLLGAANRRR